MVAEWWDNGGCERSNRLHISGFWYVHYRLGYTVNRNTYLAIDNGSILDLQRLFALGIDLIINPLSLHEGLDVELIAVRDTQGDILFFRQERLPLSRKGHWRTPIHRLKRGEYIFARY